MAARGDKSGKKESTDKNRTIKKLSYLTLSLYFLKNSALITFNEMNSKISGNWRNQVS